MRYIILSLVLLSICSCKENNKRDTKSQQLKIGKYRAVIDVQDQEELPFIFEVTSPNEIKIYNAEETIAVDEISYRNDSVFIKAPVFEGYIAAAFDGNNLNGSFIKESLDRVVPFSAEYNKSNRFEIKAKPQQTVSGIWETVFSEGIADDQYIAKGIFKQEGSKVTGTFRTTTGDYRYLEGVMDGDIMKLSTFDGAHAFLFTAKVSDSTMEGSFYSGNHWKEPFVAKRNESYELPNADELTFIKEGYDKLEFSFPDVHGNMISLSDDRFKNKVVIVQIMGTWCPNCLDESKYYTNFYKDNKDKNFEIVALAFEYAKTEEKAFNSISRLRKRLNIDYPILLAQYGTSDKEKAQEKLPMLNRVLSYPTSIFIDKTGKVRKIHTGFNGPATGEKYSEFKKDFETVVDNLLNE
ncbi:peroxiredoxin family protein [Winogradskyella bathintestinalis]|uniref:TlpA disulfide reductase family protein n=1 Tax=Winogradskyella bathintestinalis TaxID=3035208 RepID=A0ABT7ZVH7_9FLAO|nr:TlpA disulfide reductase family protein [Winogradskyella bathintestinalis]MDN3493008.1 TlpA disulfide reductase family protein [Winogradskyella bathintestinalis]